MMIYEVSVMNDDGRAVSGKVLFSNSKAANDYAEKLKAWSGGIKPILVFDSLNDYETNNLDARKLRALAKLTEEDKLTLGLVVP
jgi:hypothetical protein